MAMCVLQFTMRCDDDARLALRWMMRCDIICAACPTRCDAPQWCQVPGGNVSPESSSGASEFYSFSWARSRSTSHGSSLQAGTRLGARSTHFCWFPHLRGPKQDSPEPARGRTNSPEPVWNQYGEFATHATAGRIPPLPPRNACRHHRRRPSPSDLRRNDALRLECKRQCACFVCRHISDAFMAPSCDLT